MSDVRIGSKWRWRNEADGGQFTVTRQTPWSEGYVFIRYFGGDYEVTVSTGDIIDCAVESVK